MMDDMALSAPAQMSLHIDSRLEPKLDRLLVQKVKPQATLQITNKNIKKGAAKKGQNYKFKNSSLNLKKQKSNPRERDLKERILPYIILLHSLILRPRKTMTTVILLMTTLWASRNLL